MKHTTRLITALCLSIPILFSCVPQTTTRGDYFEIEFDLNTPVFYDGDYVSFTVKTNRPSVKVTAFDFKESPEFVKVNSTYNITDGFWTQKASVPVPESRRGRMSITFMDPETGATKDFQAEYTAYASTNLRLSIDNDIISSAKLKARVPTIVGGDDFKFTVSSKAEKLMLKDFKCEFNDGQLERGQEYIFGEEGRINFSIPSVKVTEDKFDEPSQLSLTFYNPDTEKDTTVTADYVKVMAFNPSVSINPSSIVDGDIITVRFTGNRSTYRLDSYSAPDWFKMSTLYNGSPISLDIDGYKEFESEPVTISENSKGEISFQLTDSEYTQRTMICKVDYSTQAKQDPWSVVVDKSSAIINNGEVLVIKVTTNDTYSTNLFHAQMLNSVDNEKLLFYAPKAGETTAPEGVSDSYFTKEVDITANTLYIKGLDKHGTFKVKVCAKNRTNVYKEISISVRRDVALKLKGLFSSTSYSTTYKEGLTNIDITVGWNGLPLQNQMTAELVSYVNSSSTDIMNISKDNVNKYVTFYSLNDGNTSPFNVSFIVTFGNQCSSKMYFGTYGSAKEATNAIINNNTSYATYPSSLNTVITEAGTNGSIITCSSLCSMLRNMDLNYYMKLYNWITGTKSSSGADDVKLFNYMKIELDSVTYDRDKYNLKYFVNTFDIPGETGSDPWFKTIYTNNSWITKIN